MDAKIAPAPTNQLVDLASLRARQLDLGKRLLDDAALWREMEPQFLSHGDIGAAQRARARAQAYTRCAELIMALQRGTGGRDDHSPRQ